MSVVMPFIKTPLTDVTSLVMTHQHFSRCAEFERRVIHCFENYGIERAKKECPDHIADFEECFSLVKQSKRIEIMRNERHRQYKDGERTKENYFAEPPVEDSYISV